MTIKEEVKNLIITFGVIFLIITFSFFKEDLLLNFIFSLHLFFSFVVPGYMFVSLLLKDLKVFEKMILGCITWMGVNGICAYYLNWIGLSTKFFAYIFPIVSILILGIIFFKRENL